MNPTAAIIINLALLFYSIGVWSERIQGRLKVWHTVFFWFGLVCDTWGTGMAPEPADFLWQLQFRVKSYDDDRTAVCLWEGAA